MAVKGTNAPWTHTLWVTKSTVRSPTAKRDVRSPRDAGAADECAQARQQFEMIEWLGQVIVGAQIQGTDLVEGLAAYGEHQDGDLRYLADAAADVEAIGWRHLDVEDNYIGLVDGKMT